MDEVLAVGDAAFQKKCLGKMGDVSGEGRTILFVSHNMPAMETLCGTGILLERGAIAVSGSAGEVVEAYLHSSRSLSATPIGERVDRQGNGRLRFTDIETSLTTGRPSRIRVSYIAEPNINHVEVAFGLFTERGEGALHLSNIVAGQELKDLPRAGTITCEIPAGNLLPGRYTVNLFCRVNEGVADWVTDASTIEVLEGDFFGTGRLPPRGYGSVVAEQRWSAEG